MSDARLTRDARRAVHGASPRRCRTRLRRLPVAWAFLATVGAWADHHCPDDRPYPRGSTACDSCDWRATLESYRGGDLSTVRESRLFEHQLQVSVFCDAGRPVDVEDVFAKLDAVEAEFDRLFGRTLDHGDGEGQVLEVVVGICDVNEDVDDCAMHTLCRNEWGRRCAVNWGESHRNTPTGHTAFVPWLAEGVFWWVDGNRYANLQHEFGHLMDFTYLRPDAQRGPDTDWWVEGLPHYLQWRQLRDQLSWDRGNDDATILDVLTHRPNTSEYYDGMRVFAFLAEHDPWMIERAAAVVRNGVYASPERHLYWHDFLGHIAWRHQRGWEYWISVESEGNAAAQTMLPGFVDGAAR